MDKTNKILISISAVLMIVIIVLIILSLNKKVSTYTITFNPNNGDKVSELSVEKNTKISKPANPEREGYLFIEWQCNNTPFDFNSKINENKTLTAVWQEVKENAEMITIEFDSNGGSLVSKQIIEKGTKAKKPEDPTKKNYQFVGWTINNKVFNFEEELNEDTVLKAKWDKKAEKSSEKDVSPKSSNKEESKNNKEETKEFTITFDSNGGSDIASQKVNEDSKVTIPGNPSKTGYTFYDWLLNGNSYNFDNPVTDDLTLTASWTPNKYVISYNINAENGAGTMENTTCEYDKECSLNSNNYSQENYSFIGWGTSANGGVVYSNNAKVTNLTNINNEVITLYAIWSRND